MRRLTWLCVAILAATGCSKKEEAPKAPEPPLTNRKPDPPPEPPKPAVDPAVLARGDYLVNVVMNCAACHTPIGPTGPVMEKRFAGGLEFPEPFGTWRSPNITQDQKTGIGSWTDEQIAAAIRTGKRPNGDQMYPIMPYMFYNVLSDDDIKAVVAYLRTIAPIENAVAGNTDLKLPKIPAPPPAGTAPADDPVAQGAYYASLMHCAQCHTPMGPEGPDMKKLMAGDSHGMEMPAFLGTGKLYSANVTPDKKTGIGSWSDDDVIAVITQLKKKDGSPVMGPMAILGMNWGKMQPEHVKGVVAWLRSLPPVENKIPKSTFKPAGPPPGAAPPGEAPKGEAPKGEAPKGEAPAGEAPQK
jgi:mono/diheme cytochrome c family protein